MVAVALTLLPAAAARAVDTEPVLERCLVSLMEEAKVPAREAGVLEELLAREGDVVKRGDVIAKIPRELQRLPSKGQGGSGRKRRTGSGAANLL